MDRSPPLRLLHWIDNKESGGEGRHSDAVAPHGQVKPEADILIHIYVRECCKLRVISEVIGKLLSGA